MVFTLENTKGKRVKVLDYMGKEVAFVRSYDTETREVELIIASKKDSSSRLNPVVIRKSGERPKILIAKVLIPGSKIIVDGTEY